MPPENLRETMGQVAGQTHAAALMQLKEKLQLLRRAFPRALECQPDIICAVFRIAEHCVDLSGCTFFSGKQPLKARGGEYRLIAPHAALLLREMIFPSLSQSNPAGNLKDIITLEQFHGNIVPECDLPEHFNGEMPHGTRQGRTPPRRPLLR